MGYSEVMEMLNGIWGMMLTSGLIFGILTGRASEVTEALTEGAKEGISLSIILFGIMGFWCGLMEIAEKTGILGKITEKMKPFLHFMFPAIPKDHKALEYIAINFTANMFGLASAATPAGLQAMRELEKLRSASDKEEKNKIASEEMCNFLILNISSLQLIPVSIIAYRAKYGSPDPAAVTAPALLATFVSTGVGVLICRFHTLFANAHTSEVCRNEKSVGEDPR